MTYNSLILNKLYRKKDAEFLKNSFEKIWYFAEIVLNLCIDKKIKNMTKYKTLASTKTINSSNSKSATRGYKMMNPAHNRCSVSIVVRGKEIGICNFTLDSKGKVSMSSKAVFSGANVTPADVYEAMGIANRYFSLTVNK
jgi:hypothetical protein